MLFRIVLASFCHASAIAQSPMPVALGTVTDATITDAHWQSRRLSELSPRRAIVVYFATLECPMVARYLPRVGQLAREYASRGVATLVVNVGAGDAFVDAVGQVVEHAPSAFFAKDFELALARACGVDRSGAVIVLDGERRLRYRGRVDDQHGYSGSRTEASRSDVTVAVDSVLAGEDVVNPETAITGCRLTPLSPFDPARTAVYARDVAPLLQRNCLHCHSGDGAAPFGLGNEVDAKKHGAMLAEVVSTGRMPPWFASTASAQLADARGLSFAEREIVRQWFVGGMPRGPDDFGVMGNHPKPTPWRVGPPSEVIECGPLRISAATALAYQTMELPRRFTVDTWVQAIDVLSQTPRQLHHANVAVIPENATFDPARIVANYVPHGRVLSYEPGTALRIPAGHRLVVQAYYVPDGKEIEDRLQVGLVYPGRRVDKEVRISVAVAEEFEVPAGTNAHPVEATTSLPDDAVGVAAFVHMHLRGRDATVFAQGPDAATVTLLAVPCYNFGGQESYRWIRGSRTFAKGTRLTVRGHFDNSIWNPFNPDASCSVRPGPSLQDERLQLTVWWFDRDQQLGLQVDPRTGTVEAGKKG